MASSTRHHRKKKVTDVSLILMDSDMESENLSSLIQLSVSDGQITDIIYRYLSHDVASGSDITPCNKIDKPLVVYRFSDVTL